MTNPTHTIEPAFALLRCCDCEHTFPDRLPPMYEDLPECPLCGSGPVQLLELLEPDTFKH